MTTYNETRSRSVVKAISWRLVVIISDSLIVYTFTRNVDLTVSLVSIKAIATTILYYFNERTWNAISWGKKKR